MILPLTVIRPLTSQTEQCDVYPGQAAGDTAQETSHVQGCCSAGQGAGTDRHCQGVSETSAGIQQAD